MKKGNRHYDKWWKELWWFIQENLFEIITVGMMIITLVAIFVALFYERNI